MTYTDMLRAGVEARTTLARNPDWVAVPTDPALVPALLIAGVPNNRIAVLGCVITASDRTQIAYLTRHQLAYYRSQENKLLSSGK